MTGYTAEEITGQNPRIFKSNKQDAPFYKKMWETITKGKEWRGELQNKKKNGEIFWVYVTISLIRKADNKVTHYLAIEEDITEEKKNREALALSEERYREQNRRMDSIVETLPDGILVLDLTGVIQVANKTFKDLIQTVLAKKIDPNTNITTFADNNPLITTIKTMLGDKKEQTVNIEPKPNLWIQLTSAYSKLPDKQEPFAVIVEARNITAYVKQFTSSMEEKISTLMAATAGTTAEAVANLPSDLTFW